MKPTAVIKPHICSHDQVSLRFGVHLYNVCSDLAQMPIVYTNNGAHAYFIINETIRSWRNRMPIHEAAFNTDVVNRKLFLGLMLMVRCAHV